MSDINKFKTVEFAYWLGLVQADCAFSRWTNKNGKCENELHMEVKSEILIKEFQKGLVFINRFPNYFKTKRNVFTCKSPVNSVLPVLKSINLFPKHKFIPPDFISKNKILFGAYLAGVIDGDGNVRVKRKKYPQCAIRITSDSEQVKLITLIKKFLSCSVSNAKINDERYFAKENRIIKGSWNVLEFLISSKNFIFFLNYVLPFIKLNYKKEMIENFIKKDLCAERDLNPRSQA